MVVRTIRFLLFVAVSALAGCFAGVDYDLQPETDDALIGNWKASSERDIYFHVSRDDGPRYRAVMIDNEAITRFDFLVSRIAGGTYVNVDLSTVSILEHRSRNIETLKQTWPVYFLLLYRKEDAQVIVVPANQRKLLQDFRAPQATVGTINGRCPVPDALFEPPKDGAGASADGRHVCVLAVSNRSNFEDYLREQQKALFGGEEMIFRRIR